VFNRIDHGAYLEYLLLPSLIVRVLVVSLVFLILD
jgi:hypothetical protein